ncbi:putative late blight resistance protein homolog R1B-17 [Andrographis paniculata]|uniref:putative late blight resistance protein homolog R1B-17 n=1 Tax=Andrographis paniculata TaxID=175694 RepID=UPI0021E71782|nr:putative late blight resistance protein homolog R1B-17 [Andrographis paniculata]
MAAYASLAPLGTSLHHLLNSSQIQLQPSIENLLQSAYDEIVSLQKVVEDFDPLKVSANGSERAKALDRCIKETVDKFEDALEPQLSTQYLKQIKELDQNRTQEFILDLGEVEQEIVSFIEILMKLKEEYFENMNLNVNEMSYPRKSGESVEDSEEAIDYLRKKYREENNSGKEVEEVEDVEYDEEFWRSTSNYQMVGLVDKFVELRSLVVRSSYAIISVVGMAGIGKTTLVKQLFNDPLILNHFKYRAFVSIGQKYESKQVIIDVLSQIENHDIEMLRSLSEKKLYEYMQRTLEDKRYLLVLDDVWDTQLCVELSLYGGEKCRVLLTSRVESVYGSITTNFYTRFLNEEESWFLLREKVFGKDSSCPSKLVEVGKKIAKNCEGLPLAIIGVAKLLPEGEKTVEYWNKVSEDENPLSIGMDEQKPMFDTLYSSYHPLSQCLKSLFLYMGVFPRKHEIVASKLILLWEAEGFVQTRLIDNGWEQIFFTTCLEELVSQNVVLIVETTLEGKIKTCKLHSVFWHLCIGEARKENLFRIVRGYSSDSFAEWIKGQRRLCVQNNTLFGIRDSYESISSLSNARSLLCTGARHDYPVPMCFDMMLLRVLDALTIRFYVFPYDVVKLVLLRYLAFTYTGILHSSISKLWNLRFLIIRRHLCIISPKHPLHLPIEIWNMKELRHLHITGAILPEPYVGAILPKLTTILDINARSLTPKVVDAIPNVENLGIEIDSSTDDPFAFFNHVSRLDKLTTLECSILNPKPKSQTIAPPSPAGIFPLMLRKLTLSGFGYPWKYMKEIGKLKFLEVLKLRNYAFQGVEWEANRWDNPNLKFLSLEDLDLVHWRLGPLSFCRLVNVMISHCYKLEEIPKELGFSSSRVEAIKLVEVKPSVVMSAKEVLRRRNRGNVERMQLEVDCSWEEDLPT